MATKASWNDTAPEGVELDSKKNLVVTTYKDAVDLKADAFKDSGAKTIDASKATNAVELKGGDKAMTFTTGANGSTVVGSSKNDKINLGTGKDVIQNTVGSAGNDAINNYDSAKDVIEIYGKTSSQATFTDKGASVVITFNGSKEKLTVNKKDADGKISLKFSDGDFEYGALPTGVTYDDKSKKTAINVTSTASTTVDASKLASTAKTINATKAGSNATLNIIGNGQGNTISLGGGGGTVYGGYAYDAAKGSSKATADKLYGGDGKDVFVFDASLGGSDQVFGYDNEDGDIIKITDKTSEEIAKLLSDTKTFKDSGKNVVLTLDKSKLTIDGTPKQITFRGSDDKDVVYGPALPEGAYIDQKKTTLYLTKDTNKQSDPIELAVNDTVYAQYNFAPKLKAIDASAYTGSVILGSKTSSIASDLKAGSGGSTLIGSTNADNLYGSSVKGSADVFVYTVASLVGGGKDKIFNFNGIEEGDVVKISNYDANIHSLVLTEKSGKSLNISINNKATGKSIGQIDINDNPSNKTILIVDDENKIIATNPATTPIGLAYDVKKNTVTTDDNYTGAYEAGSYLIGDVLPDNNAALNHSDASATIRASDYSSKLAVINASSVASSVAEMLIEGNADVKNVLTASNTNPVSTTLKGGLTQSDVLNGSTVTGSTDYFYVTPNVNKAKKDAINNYDENDVIVIQATQNIQSLTSLKDAITTNNFIKFDDKSADAVLTLEKSVITVKDGAGKQLNLKLVDENGNVKDTASIGHLLPTGLKYDAKKVTIALKDKATTEAADVGGDNSALGLSYGTHEGNTGNAGYIALDLNNANYFNTVKTINLSKINDKVPTDDDPTEIKDNSVHVTLLGNALANEFRAGGNAASTNILYGGKGDLNKPETDKFYGSKGTDVFVYQLGDGKDVISDSKSGATTKYNAGDWIVLAGGSTDAVLSRDNIFITDNSSVVNVQLGTDTKKGTLTINKAAADTPINFVLTKDSDAALAVAAQITNGEIQATTESTNDYTIYNYGLSNETLASELNAKGLLNISGTQNLTEDDLAKAEFPLVGNVYTKDISSAIKNIGVGGSAGDTLSVYIVGNNNANQISLGAGGGTVDGGYFKDAKGKVKATADKYYGGTGADVFMFNTLTDAAGNDVAGKDVIYNYDPGNDAIRINSLDDIKEFKYSGKNVAFTFKGAKAASKNNVLTIQGISGKANDLPSDTQISFIVGEEGNTSIQTYTFFDKKTTTKISDLDQVFNPWTTYKSYESESKNEAWTINDDVEDLNVWHYTSNDWTRNGLNFTVSNISDHYTNKKTNSHIDINTNITGSRPVGISVVEPYGNVIVVDQTSIGEGKDASIVGMLDFSDFWFNKDTTLGAEGVHIQGANFRYKADGTYNGDDVASVEGKGEYRLANLDGDTTNGYELLKMNDLWKLTQDNKWLYAGDVKFTVDTGSDILDVREYGDNGNDNDYNTNYAGSPFSFYVNGYNMTIDSGVKADQIKFQVGTKVGVDGIHINGFDTMTSFNIGQKVNTVVGGTSTMTTVYSDYLLANLDGNTVNGYELIKKNDHWTLTPEEWKYENGSTKFEVNLIAPTLTATTEGTPTGITVSNHPSLNAAGFIVDSLSNNNTGMVLDFSNLSFDNNVAFNESLLAFDAGIATGRNGVHIKGLKTAVGDKYSGQVTVGSDAYWLVNLDDDMVSATDYRKYNTAANAEATPNYYTNGLELAKVNDNWTPVFNTDKDNQNWAYADDNVQFTLTSQANVKYIKDGAAADYYTNANTFAITDDGAVNYITVSADGVIEVGSELTKDKTSKIGNENVTIKAALGTQNDTTEGYDYIQGIAFENDVNTGAKGIHIKGYDADTRIKIATGDSTSITYQLVDLDGDSINGNELMQVDDNWTLKGGVWSYSNDDVAFTFDKNSGLVAADNGQASGVSVDGSTVIFNLDDEAKTKALNSLTFTNFTNGTGTNAIQFVGLPADTYVNLRTVNTEANTTTTTKYQLVDLDKTDNATLEAMAIDDKWTFKNNAWTFADATSTSKSKLEFSISANASIRPNADGTPAKVTYVNTDNDGKEVPPTLSFADADNFIATNLTITKLINTTEKSTLYGAKGLHIVTGEADSEGALKVDTQLTVGGTKYQVVNLDDNDENYELMKVDGNWTLNSKDEGEDQWSYYSANAGGISIGASEFTATDDGKPKEFTLTTNANGATLDVSGDAFKGDDAKSIEQINIYQAALGTDTKALRVYGGTNIEEGTGINIVNESSEYVLINLDKNDKNGFEIMKKDDNWEFDVSAEGKRSWVYSNEDVAGIEFSIAGGELDPLADGTPSQASVDAENRIITLPKKMTDTSKITLTSGSPGIDEGSEHSVHFKFTGASVSEVEGKTISDGLSTEEGGTTYALYDADGDSTNGYELTYGGWLQTTVKGFDANGRANKNNPEAAFRYKSSKADYYLSGTAFGEISNGSTTYNDDTPNYAVIADNGSISFTGTNIDTTSKNFHIKSDTVELSTVKVNDVTFTLQDIDNNDDNGLELTYNGWAKSDANTFVNLDGEFTITAGAADTDSNNAPDGITYNGMLTLGNDFNSTDKAEAIKIKASKSWDMPTIILSNESLNNGYTATITKGNVEGKVAEYTITLTSKTQTEGNGQLPAEGYSTSGYEVDDLLNYESEGIAASDELDQILDVKPLAANDQFNVGTLFDGHSDMNDLTALTQAARHRQKK